MLEEKKVDISDIAKEENKLKASKLEEDRVIKGFVAKINELKTKISNKDHEVSIQLVNSDVKLYFGYLSYELVKYCIELVLMVLDLNYWYY